MKLKIKISYIKDFRLCDKDHFLILKGISILFVVLAHYLDQYLNIPGLLPLQGVASAVFLLCSGYGVSESFKNKKGLTHYWENKAIKVWVPSVVVLMVTGVVLEGNAIIWIGSNPLALYGWFLYLLFAEYLSFWLAFYFLEDKTAQIMGLFAVSAVAFFVLERHEMAVQVFCFPVGVLFSQLGLKYPVRAFTPIRRILLCVVLAGVAVGGFFLSKVISQPLTANLCNAVFCLSAGAFLCVGVYFARKIGIFGVFAPLGVISYALYLIHEPVLMLLTGQTDGRIIAAIWIVLLILSALFVWLITLLVNGNRKLRRNKKNRLKGSMR